MQVEKDIIVARDFINGNVYNKVGYRPVKIFTDQTLKSLKKLKFNDRNILCKINSIDEVIDLISYGGNVVTYSDNRFDEYFLKLKLAGLNLSRKEYINYFIKENYDNFEYKTYLKIRKFLDDKTKYFFDELYKYEKGNNIRHSKLFVKDIYSYEELFTLIRYLIDKRYYEVRETYNNKKIKFIYSKDEKIKTKVKELYNFIFLSYDVSNLSDEKILKIKKNIMENFKDILDEYGKIQCFYSKNKIQIDLEKKEYKLNPSINNDIINIYTYKNKTIEK